MFSKKKSTLGKSTENFESLIGGSLRIDGNFIISKCVRIDGTVHGNIFQAEDAEATVAVAKGAVVVGDIRAKHIIISGQVKGNILSSGRVEVLASAEITGDIRYDTLGLEIGACLNGRLDRINDAEYKNASVEFISQVRQGQISS